MIGDVIKALRMGRNWSQAELVRRTGLKSGYLSGLESGDRKNPTQKTLEKLARAFEMPLGEFMAALGIGEHAPPDALRDAIVDAEYRRLTRVWAALTESERLGLVAAAEAMAQARNEARRRMEEDDAPPEYVAYTPTNGK